MHPATVPRVASTYELLMSLCLYLQQSHMLLLLLFLPVIAFYGHLTSFFTANKGNLDDSHALRIPFRH